jgi:dienelactone hydrolase
MRKLVTLVFVATVTLAAAACTPIIRPQPVPHRLPGHIMWTQTFVDASRPTVPATGPSLPSRTLVTAIYRPNGRGPFPLIVFAHGLAGHPDKFTKLFSVWADAGFVVVAPAFPLTNDHTPNPNANAADVKNQPGDMSFVLTQVLALDHHRGTLLHGAINPRRIGAGGLSLGGITTYSLVYGACCRDNRFDAAEALDGLNGSNTIDGHVPLFIGHSDSDPLIPYATAQTTFNAATPPVWFLTLHGASHASQWEDTVTPYDHIAEQTTTDFWNATLRHRLVAYKALVHDATVPGLASIQARF